MTLTVSTVYEYKKEIKRDVPLRGEQTLIVSFKGDSEKANIGTLSIYDSSGHFSLSNINDRVLKELITELTVCYNLMTKPPKSSKV